MRIHFFTAPFYFAFIGFRVQGSGFKVQVAASPPFLLKVQPAPVARARYRLPVEPCPENRSENFFKNPLAKYGGIVYNTFRRTARVLTAK